MELVVTPTLAIGVKGAMPTATRVRDLVARRCEIQIRFQGDDYRRSRDFFVTRESGSTFTLTIRGKPGFCLAALQNLIGAGQTDAPIGTPAEIFSANVHAINLWELRAPLRDIFHSAEEVHLELTSSSHTRDKTFLVADRESGAKLSVSIEGKPGFAQLAAAQLNLNAPLIRDLMARVLTP
jgi:hypothetical protein